MASAAEKAMESTAVRVAGQHCNLLGRGALLGTMFRDRSQRLDNDWERVVLAKPGLL